MESWSGRTIVLVASLSGSEHDPERDCAVSARHLMEAGSGQGLWEGVVLVSFDRVML